MKRLWIGVAIGSGLLLAVGCGLRDALTLRLMDRAIARNMTTDLLDTLPDGLHVLLCGAGSPLPDLLRSGPCTAVVAGDRLFVVDVGSGASRVMSRVRLPQGEIEAILLTHFHSDHIDGLGELEMQRWANGGHAAPVPIHGPTGVELVVDGINRAYTQSRAYRVAHHGEEVVPASGAGAVARPFPTPVDGEGHVVLEGDGLVITAFRVAHDPVRPAVGYRFDYAGRSVVVSGDTVKSENLRAFATSVDLLVHEALAPKLVQRLQRGADVAGRERLSAITRDIVDYHTSPVEAAELAEAAGVGHLLYNHVVPPLPLAPLESIFVEGVDDAYGGPFTVGRDGTLVRLDAGGDAIEVEELL